MARVFFAVLGLASLWLLMSGLYKPLIFSLGAVSVILTVFFITKMDKVDEHQLGYDIGIFSTFKYLVWLFKEIAKSNIAVTKIILSGDKLQNQKMFEMPVSQKSEIAQVVFANSITLTPGTITVETEDDNFIVHALDFSDGDMDSLLEMDANVSAIETTNAGVAS
jgi:multicomponent Na+:H+ antiporter subunit E